MLNGKIIPTVRVSFTIDYLVLYVLTKDTP